MGLKSQFQIASKQRNKRRKLRKKLLTKGMKSEDYFYGKYYLKAGEEKR